MCANGYDGEDCSIAVRPTHSSDNKCIDNCSGRGVCRNNTCLCPPGYFEADCSQMRLCDNDCSGHGVCNQGVCECAIGFIGEDCAQTILVEQASCPHNCFNRGSCFNGRCSCDPGYTGVDCAEVVADMCGEDLSCNGNGRCENGLCWCDLGWSGDGCDVKTECPSACSDKGLCKWGQCWCDKYWTGDDCSQENGEIPGSNAGVSTRDSIIISVAVCIGGALAVVIWKELYHQRRQSQLRAFLQTSDEDKFGVGSTFASAEVQHIGDYR